MKKLNIELNQLEYQSIQFALRWTFTKFFNTKEYNQLSPAFRRILSGVEGLMEGKFCKIIGEKKYDLDGEDLNL